MHKTRQVSIRFDEDLYSKFENDARKNGVSLTEFVRKKVINSFEKDAENERYSALEKRIELTTIQMQKNTAILQRIDQAISLFLQTIQRGK